MARDPVAARYTQALYAAAEGQQVHEILACLELVARLMREQPALGQFLRHPDIEPEDKVAVLDRALDGQWPGLLRAFMQMVVSMGRAEDLEPMAEAFRSLVDDAEGQLRVRVRSVHPLSEASLTRLRTRLERLEGKHVVVTAEQAPELLGGVQVVLDHRVIDGSVRRQLVELRQRLKAIRVN
ncbi:MAG TPA: ATP synthase F1 subunit delta [archaeon]|nr:ATP synthase F1 subunit delta [archaeon]